MSLGKKIKGEFRQNTFVSSNALPAPIESSSSQMMHIERLNLIRKTGEEKRSSGLSAAGPSDLARERMTRNGRKLNTYWGDKRDKITLAWN
jgi:hypothetical protein